MKPDKPGAAAELDPGGWPDDGPDRAAAAVTAPYEASALGLIRMAYVMLGDLPSAEDVVQEAFCSLYRRWDRLADQAGATYYVRTSVLNGCRSALRRRTVRRGVLQHGPLADPPSAVSAETVVLGGEEREDVIRALRRLPDRQREVLILRFYADLRDEQIARVMGIQPRHGPVHRVPRARRAGPDAAGGTVTVTGGGDMTPLEDRVQEAIRAKAAEVPPHAVPPLRLPARRRSSSLPHGGRERGRRPARRARAARAWAAPIGAAAGVAAALAVVLALTSVIHAGRSASGRPTGLAALPRYYVALTFTGNSQCCEPGKYDNPRTHAVVRVTRTARSLATIAVPRPYDTFVGVTAAADDRTFILAAQKLSLLPHMALPGTKFFLLRIDPGRRHPAERARLTPLPVPDLPAGTAVSDFALSPDGTRLAVLGGTWNQEPLGIYDLRTGAVRAYIPAGVGSGQDVGVNQNSLSWASDGRTLAFLYYGDPGAGGCGCWTRPRRAGTCWPAAGSPCPSPPERPAGRP